MDFDDARQREVFFAVHSGLPREGPGDHASTRAALERVGSLPERARVLDIGCGPGLQTLHLAELLPSAEIVAVDLHAPFVEQLNRRAGEAGLGSRVRAEIGDMGQLRFEPESFDLLWCEGAAYILGFRRALEQWRCLLRPGGSIALTEAVWLSEERPPRVEACWAEYPEMTDLEGCRSRIRAAGYEQVAELVLGPEAWTVNYYDPMQLRLDELRDRFGGDPVAEAVLDECQEEIDVFRLHGDLYSYAFFVLRPG